MTAKEQAKAAANFAEYWKGKGYEKGESQKFWLSLLRDVYGIEHPEQFISFEDQVHLEHTSFIDGYIPETKVMIEQKSLDKDLNKAIRQSDGTLLTPFEQAKRYITELPLSQHPRWLVICNFGNFCVYDMEKPQGEPEKIELKNLGKEYYRLSFLVETESVHLKKEMEISIAAGDIVGVLYDALYSQYKDPTNIESQKSLNMLCVRLVFCLYAEDAGIFGRHLMFHDYMSQYSAKEWRGKLIELFRVLDQKPEERDPYIADDLAAFPFVNGGLFSDENIEIPNFTDEIKDIILSKASNDFDWSEISPTIFGAVFESTLNPDTRRSGGMHYTSIENIHKVIDPLFLDDLKQEFEELKDIRVERTRKAKLAAFQDKLAGLTFLDPACGSGNFLTETFLSLRRLENRIIQEMTGGQMTFGDVINPIKVSIQQFNGIEINDFAVTVAKTALWIAESQMMKETEKIVHMNLEFLPLKTNAHIVENNALRMNWKEVVEKKELNYIMGNPPFLGYALQTKEQKSDIQFVAPGIGSNIDYVAMWYFKAAEFIQDTNIRVAFVSTNSISQGEQVAVIWKPLFEKYGIHIDFAYRTFIWDSEASLKAHVHCVIIGFSLAGQKRKLLFKSDHVGLEVDNINPYLVDAPTVFIERRSLPLCDVPPIFRGSQPTDDGNLILSSDEREELIKKEPACEKYIRPYMMGKDFIDRKYRYCLWLDGADPGELKKMPMVLDRIAKVREFRLRSKKEATRRKANTPTLFDENHECKTNYIAIPIVSSQNRNYIPMELLPQNVIAGNKLFMMPNASLYHFGVLTSIVHMAWVRTVTGRLKSDYSYSNTIVYNNFPWPTPTEEQYIRIEKTAQMILDAREKNPNSSLAALYDDMIMPSDLRTAHQQNDKAVLAAYGIKPGDEEYKSESACVAMLMKLYQRKVEELSIK